MSFYNDPSNFDPTSMLALLGAAAGAGQFAGASRLPQTLGQAFAGAAGGLGAGIQAGQKYQLSEQEITEAALKNWVAQNAVNQQMGALGQAAPSRPDLAAGRGLPDWQNLFWGANGPGSTAPQLPTAGTSPQGDLLNSMLPSATAAAGLNLPNVPNTSLGASPGSYAAPAPGVGGAVPQTVADYATAHNLDPDFFTSLIHGESRFDPNAVGPKTDGSGRPQEQPLGIAQIKPSTAQQWGVDPLNPGQALGGAANFLANTVAQSGSHVAAAQAYGTIPHDLSKMDANQTAVYQAAVAADQRMKLAQNTSTGAVSDAGAGITGQPQQPQPLQPAAPQQPGMGAPMMSMDALKNTVLQRAFRNASGVPLTPVENQVLAAGMYPQGSSMNRLVLNEATKAAGIPTFIGGERPGVPGRSLSGFDANGMPQYTTAFQNPSVERGQLVGPGGSISTAPGYVPSMAEIENARSFAKVPAAMYEKGVNVLPGGAVGPVAGFAPTMGAQKGAEAGAVATATNQANYGGLMPGGAIPSGAGPSAFGPAAPGPAAPGAAPPAAPPIAVPGIKPGDPIPLGLAQTNMTARVAAQYRPVDTGRGTLIPPLNSQVIPGSAEELKSAIPAWQTKTTQWTDAIAPAQAAEQRLQTVASAFKTIQTGAWQSDKAEVSAMMRSLGLPESWLFTNPEAVEKALHANVVGTLQNLKSTNPRFAQSEFKVLSANSENPNLQPGANLELLSQDMATLSQSQQLARDWNDAQQLGWKNPLSFETQWTQQNPLSTAVEWQRQNIGPLMGMPGGPGTPGAARIFHDPTTGHEIIQRGGQWLDRQTGMPLNTPAPSAPSVPIR